MKKMITLLMSLILVFSLVACGNDRQAGDGKEPDSSETANQTPDAKDETDGMENEENAGSTENGENAGSADGKTLVVYYSATGSTESVAEVIARETGADLFALEPAEPYTNEDLNYNDDDSRVSKEHENEEERVVELVSVTPDNWGDYDTVFIGYPIWWGIAAWPVNGFIENNDFTGKTVIPFCTSASSGLGESGELLAEMAGTGDWQEGQRFRSSVSEDDVAAWVNGLGL